MSELEDAALTVIEFTMRLDARPEATPDIREAVAMEKLAKHVLASASDPAASSCTCMSPSTDGHAPGCSAPRPRGER